jgi:hypothetical protein
VIQYAGCRTEFGIKVALIGDGVTRAVQFDLTQAPFNMSMNNNNPVAAFVRSEDGVNKKPTITIPAQNKILLTYDQPLPLPSEGALSPRSQLEIYIFFD